MKKLIVLMSFFILLSCSSESAQSERKQYPDCVTTEINTIMENYSPRTPKSTVKKYKYNEQFIYVVAINGIADELYPVYNENCELLCRFGGIANIEAVSIGMMRYL
jgi:hypothetical protein